MIDIFLFWNEDDDCHAIDIGLRREISKVSYWMRCDFFTLSLATGDLDECHLLCMIE